MTETLHATRVLVVSHGTAFTPDLVRAVRERAMRGPARFRLVVPNPAHAEVHLLHPDRHAKAAEAERDLSRELPALEAAAGGPVVATVSVRNDPMDAVEEVLHSEPIEEIILAVGSHPIARRLHQDLPHRLKHYGLPITTVGAMTTL